MAYGAKEMVNLKAECDQQMMSQWLCPHNMDKMVYITVDNWTNLITGLLSNAYVLILWAILFFGKLQPFQDGELQYCIFNSDTGKKSQKMHPEDVEAETIMLL